MECLTWFLNYYKFIWRSGVQSILELPSVKRNEQLGYLYHPNWFSLMDEKVVSLNHWVEELILTIILTYTVTAQSSGRTLGYQKLNLNNFYLNLHCSD